MSAQQLRTPSTVYLYTTHPPTYLSVVFVFTHKRTLPVVPTTEISIGNSYTRNRSRQWRIDTLEVVIKLERLGVDTLLSGL